MITKETAYPISNSRLTAFKRSPLHLIHYLTRPKESTPAMEFGKAFHMALLQPDLFPASYVVAPSFDKRSKEGKDRWAEFQASLKDDQNTVSLDDYNKIQRMVDAVMNNGFSADLITNLIEREKEVTWSDSETDLPMRGIVDGISSAYIIDIKTCADADPNKFQRDAVNLSYHRQAAIYVDSQPNPLDYYLIAIEKDEPHGVSVHELSPELIEVGRSNYRFLLNEYRNWVEDGCAPYGYEYWHFSGIHKFEPFNWMK